MEPWLGPRTVLVLAAAALALLTALAAGASLARRAGRSRLARARERGLLGEARAERLLLGRGYRVVGRQVRGRYGVQVDGAELLVDVRADYVVDLGASRYVAEVKTGRAAPRLETPATRRQLLEYKIAFDVDGVLLVDAEAGRVHAVEFPLPGGRRSPRGSWLAAAAVIGAVAALVAERLLAR